MSARGSENKDANSPNKSTSLNPNAAEFVPSSLKSSRLNVPLSSGKAIIDHSGSNASNNSDDEDHQYWHHQLPDDITPDFKVMGENDLHMASGLSLSGLSISDDTGASPCLLGGRSTSDVHQYLAIQGVDDSRMRHTGLGYGEDQSFTNIVSNPWGKQFMNQTSGLEEIHYTGGSNTGLLSDLENDHNDANNMLMNPVEYLASEFPSFSAERLAEIYYRNECDLNLTMGILADLELQLGGFNQNLNSKASDPNLTPLDFPVLPISDSQGGMLRYAGEDIQRASIMYPSDEKGNFSFTKQRPSGTPRGNVDFASAFGRLASQDSSQWKYGLADMNAGSSRSSQNLGSSYNGHGKSMYMGKMQGTPTPRTTPMWLETGDAVGHMYSETRKEARDTACLRNVYFEQARQAYLIGNKALAKELSAKGQFFNVQMKAAHDRARDSIYRQRNPLSTDAHSYRGGQGAFFDLHGLHVSEVIHVLKDELPILRRTARSAGQRLPVVIFVGTGHHTKGSRTPARLPAALEQYLLAEGLQYSEPQPGLLRVVLD